MIKGWQIEQDADLKRALENLRSLVPKLPKDKQTYNDTETDETETQEHVETRYISETFK